jgi:predicted nuclease with TOPRIM domain
MDFMALYGEAGMIGVVGAMFVYLVISLSKKSDAQQDTLKNLEVENKGQSESINNMEGMIIKLINRWNDSDAVRDRRYEQTMEAISDLEKQLSRMDGIMSRMNGNGGR